MGILIEQKRVPVERVEMIFNYIDTSACKPGPVENAFRKRNGIEGRFVVLYAGLMGVAQDLTAFHVQDGDSVLVSQILPYNEQMVYLDGHVSTLNWATAVPDMFPDKMVLTADGSYPF